MQKIGRVLMALGATVGMLDVIAIATHVGLTGVPWLANVALAKLALVAAGSLMVGGAGAARLGRIREEKRLELAARTRSGVL